MSYPPVVVIDHSTEDPVGVLRGALGPENENDEQTVELRVDLDLTGEKSIIIGDNKPPLRPPQKRRRWLIASQSCKRSARALGPLIYVRDARGRDPLFLIWGDNVLVSGFRLKGPTDYIDKRNRHEKGIVVSPQLTDTDGNELPPIQNIEICNMEIFHWSGVGVQVQDNARTRDHRSRGRLVNTNPDAIRVRRSFFHHNRHGPGEGYGVNSTAGAYVTIEQNVFDENRHAIAGGSRKEDTDDYSGYTARDNLILAGGGAHCIDKPLHGAAYGGILGGIIGGAIGLVGGPPGVAIGAAIGAAVGTAVGAVVGSTFCWQTHQIDMHGTKSSPRHGGEHCCGTAGETIIIERNTILYDGRGGWPFTPRGKAIKIRGNPVDKAVVDGNIFKHETEGDAIAQRGEPGLDPTNPYVSNDNEFNCGDLTAELGQGDFADDIECGDITEESDRGDITPEVGTRDRPDDFDRGDIMPGVGTGESPGQKDDFMATGVSWWARSHATGQWRYLNTMKERLPALQLGKYDDDEIWDVAPRTRRPEIPPEKYSKSGTSPWLSRSTIHP